ncbi:uncharacterized protein (TIGR00255 family) [Anaerosolibacter carboniphilus]|uniref:Uncharacterized protein (TIGR00255 family) n=1 Tax=Anaerosolibacter carboniphilus TaxID=1417629 RepID=A0A841L1B2_9FIRM|nr:YicC/YloC family endoribonuclease [Anaerosolibacter carboniphilus]MBB6216962.1 uncharacterized protein (TIGR00255 family) [Anaerosolibacter carboniphilus]
MIKSMTGFGRGEAQDAERQFTVEIKSVNHRYNDIVVRMPKRLTYLEEKIKDLIKNEVKRGRVEVYISLENLGEGDTKISLNRSLVNQYYQCLQEIKEGFDVKDDISVSVLSKFPDVFIIESKEEDEDEIWQCLKSAVLKAVEMLMKMRLAEGEKLAEDIVGRCDYIGNIMKTIEKKNPEVVQEYKNKLRDRINEMLEDAIQIDESRLSIEVAIFADKSSIAEEIVRLYSHIGQLKKSLKEQQPIGRKLDFLIQEMNREINTIGSKSSDLEIVNYVVEVKSELEKIREQVQNIE